MNETVSILTSADREELSADFAERAMFDEPLAPYTSWRIGGPADVFVTVRHQAELTTLLRFCVRRRLGWCVLGYGSNVLVGDGGIRGIVVRLAGAFTEIHFPETAASEVIVEAGGAASLALLAGQAASRGAVGIHGLAGIPATVGGAVRMNAGTDRETGEFVQDLLIQTPSRPEPHHVSAQYLYRRSNLAADAVISRVRFRFERGEPGDVRHALQAKLIRRKQTQPLHLPNAGSCFRNPPNDYAGRLIEAAGVKGWRVGAAVVSSLHANFIINEGAARAEDVAILMTRIRRAVWEKFGVSLEPEVHYIGVFTARETLSA